MPEPLSLLDLIIVALAAVGAGFVNAIAGGGTLISFPALTFVGIDKIPANITNSVALTPGYLGGAYAQREALRGQGKRMLMLLPAAAVGSLIGALLLLNSSERLFGEIVPWLILFAAGLMAIQDRVRAMVNRRLQERGHSEAHPIWSVIPIFLASIYGGYFLAGLSVILLAILGLVLDDSLTRLNALKQAIAFAVSTTAAVFYIFSGQIVWPAAAVMAVGAVVGGSLGGRLAGSIRPQALRAVVIVIAVIVAGIYFVR